MKPEMGIFFIRANFNNKYYLESTGDLKGTINGTKFKLGAGFHPNRELQKDWKKHGAGNFTIEILEVLEYDGDVSKTDYTEDLALLKMIWEEKLLKQKMEFYNR
jgi:hypothetical protein